MSDERAGASRPPRVGISSCFFHPDLERPIFKGKTLLYVEQSMAWWVQAGGAVTYPIPTVKPDAPLGPDDYVADLDGLLLHGGADVCPRTYGEEPLRPEWEGDEVRDRYELDLVQRFLAAGKPVLGICRGHQILNVAFGGTLWQDQREQGATERVHRSQERYDRNLHTVDLVEGSGLAALYGPGTVLVNSVHHQAVKDVGAGLVIGFAVDAAWDQITDPAGDIEGKTAQGLDDMAGQSSQVVQDALLKDLSHRNTLWKRSIDGSTGS